MPLLFSFVFNGLSIWWLIPSLILGGVYAWVFYRKSLTENALVRNSLFAMRFLTVSLLALLLLSPLIRTVKQRLQKPVIFIAQDVSSSVAPHTKKDFDSTLYHQNLKNLQAELANDYEVNALNFSDKVKPGFDFKETGKETDISNVLGFITEQNPNNNIGAVILLTDGIYNKGANPVTELSAIQFPIYTVALGDTIPKIDLILTPPVYNQLVYLGNSHQVEVGVKAFGAKGTNTSLKLSTNDGQVQQEILSFTKDEEVKTIKFTLDANKKGVQKINFNLVSIANEVSIQNNRQTIYVDVLDGRERVLLVADAPHPDISAIKQAVESNKNYEVNIAYADNLPKKVDEYGLVILHNLPSKNHSINSFLESIKKKNKWLIIGTQTNLSALNSFQGVMDLSSANIQSQSYTATLNPDFYAFSLDTETKNQLLNLPPLVAPFANYKLKSAGKILFKQQIGNVKTETPLLVFDDTGANKTAILIGEGIWRWRIEDFAKNNNTDAFNELISKSVQYLSAKEDKRKFRVQSSKNRYLENESILLTAELYNDAYELINEPEVSLELKSDAGKKFSFVFSRVENSYKLDISTLPIGEYDFIAKTKLGTKNYTANGSFLVEALNIELMESRANHQLLYNISKTTSGSMVYPSQIMSLIDSIKNNEKVKTVSYQEKNYQPLINLKWIFGLIVLLLSFEWFLRKRNGQL